MDSQYTTEVEQAFLGLLITDMSLYKSISSLVKPDYFHASLHGHIYNIIKTQLDDGKTISIISLNQKLSTDANYVEVGGSTYLYSLIEAFPAVSKSQIIDYAHTIKQQYIKRYMANLAQNWERMAANDDDSLEDIVQRIKSDIADIPTKQDKSEKLHYVKAADITASLDANDFVQNLLSNSALSVVYGPSNCGKTFFMTDIAFHVALGHQWRGRRTEAGGVIYVALEGPHGLRNRVAAFKEKYDIVPDNFAMVPCQVDFLHPDGNISDFIELLKDAIKDMGSVRLVVIDTLARALAGGDENAPQDMGMLVRHADRIRAETDAHVCFIHHSGKDQAKGARGHSSLRAAVDTEIELTREENWNYTNVSIVKQREMAMDEDMQFALEVIELGPNPYGEMVTSCVVQSVDVEKIQKQPKQLTPLQKFVYDAILSCIDDFGKNIQIDRINGIQKSITYEELRQRLEERGTKEFMEDQGMNNKVKSATQSARLALKDLGKINFNRNYLWLVFNEE